MSGLTFAVEGDDQGESYSDFGGCHRDDEKHEHLAVEVVVEAGERDESEVGCVEHQLEGHVNDQQIPADDDAHQTE